MSSTPKLDELLALERAYDDLPAGAEARILDGVASILDGGGGGGDGDGSDGGDGGGDGGTGHAPPASPPALVGSAAPWLARAAYVAAGIVAGASGHAVIASKTAPPPAPIATVAIASAATASTIAAADIDAGPTLTVRDLPDERPHIAAAKPSATASARPTGASRVAEERADLDVARAALARGRVEACLEALDRHARTYGEGQLAEEREVLAVQALVSAGRKAEAAERARRFQKKYPTSLFGPAVSQAISTGE